MLHDVLAAYLVDIEHSIAGIENAYVELYEEEIFSGNRANLRIRIRFDSGNLLEINEAVAVTEDKIRSLQYRYHFQDKNNTLVFRYDNTPHYPDLEKFPHHKHVPRNVCPTDKITISSVIDEAVRLIDMSDNG